MGMNIGDIVMIKKWIFNLIKPYIIELITKERHKFIDSFCGYQEDSELKLASEEIIDDLTEEDWKKVVKLQKKL